MAISIISPRDQLSLRQIFELGLLSDDMDKESKDELDHAISPGHLVLLQGFEVQGTMGVCPHLVSL